MSNEMLAALLRAIKYNSDVSSVIRLGIRYSQIALLMENAEKDGFIANEDSKIVITPRGNDFLGKYMSTNHMKGIERWLSPQNEYMVTHAEKYDIILPKRI